MLRDVVAGSAYSCAATNVVGVGEQLSLPPGNSSVQRCGCQNVQNVWSGAVQRSLRAVSVLGTTVAVCDVSFNRGPLVSSRLSWAGPYHRMRYAGEPVPSARAGYRNWISNKVRINKRTPRPVEHSACTVYTVASTYSLLRVHSMHGNAEGLLSPVRVERPGTAPGRGRSLIWTASQLRSFRLPLTAASIASLV